MSTNTDALKSNLGEAGSHLKQAAVAAGDAIKGVAAAAGDESSSVASERSTAVHDGSTPTMGIEPA